MVRLAAGLVLIWGVAAPAAQAQWYGRPYPYYYPPNYYTPPVYRPVYPPPPVYAPPVYAPYVPPAYVPPAYVPPQPSQSLMEVQRLLATLGYDAGPVDGLAGPRLAEAVQSFQRDHGETPNGRVSGETIGALREAARGRESQSVPYPAAPPAPSPSGVPDTSSFAPSPPRSTLSVTPGN